METNIENNAAPSVVRPSSEWEKETGVIVMDYGGWRDKPYEDVITKDEFLGRCCDSRCQWPREILDALIHGTNVERTHGARKEDL